MTLNNEVRIRTTLFAATFLLAACAHKPPPVVEPKALTGAPWRLEDLVGHGIIDNSQVTLQFMPSGKVSGRGGCNTYTGSVAFKGAAITFTPFAATLMACAPALLDQETRYFAALTQADSIAFDKTGALLIRVKGESKPLLFRR